MSIITKQKERLFLNVIQSNRSKGFKKEKKPYTFDDAVEDMGPWKDKTIMSTLENRTAFGLMHKKVYNGPSREERRKGA